MTDLSIIIVSYNAREDLERCLRSLADAPPEIPHEIIVVDNASSDGSADVARGFGVRVIDAPSNRGFAAANNTGIRASSGPYLLLLNPDTVVPARAIDNLVRELAAEPTATVVGPRLIDSEGLPELSFGRMISPLAELRQKRLVLGLERRNAAAVQRVQAMSRVRQWPDWVSGACLLVRRADAEAVGLLDERYFLYTEDVDFCAAIRARGGRVLFTPASEIVHLRGRSGATAPAAAKAAYRSSHVAFYEKHHPWLAPLLRAYLHLRSDR